MSSVFNLMKSCAPSFVRKTNVLTMPQTNELRRNFADKNKSDATSKQVMTQGTESEARVRVRRARPADAPRLLRFVRDHVQQAWPGLGTTPLTPTANVLLADFVSRSLSQGHSLVAEQQETRREGARLRGLALCSAVCPWDAAALATCARCVRCTSFRRLLLFSAHCLSAPALHHKYRVHNILQVAVLVPAAAARAPALAELLVGHAVRRGLDVGFPLVRFDVTNDLVAGVLDKLQLQKEWELDFEVLPSAINIFASDAPQASPGERPAGLTAALDGDKQDIGRRNFLTVYTAFPHAANLQK